MSVVHVQNVLCNFHTSKLFKIKGMHLKVTQRVTLDKGTNREFGFRHSHLAPAFLKKEVVTPNGAIAFGDQYRTSRVCCQCETEGVLIRRAIVCSGSDQERDRDHNGATNLDFAALSGLNSSTQHKFCDRPNLRACQAHIC
ncbi:hypothetical protein EDD11_002904 [Mortierella claussenii]|nr:hypothetical protein EDD11_002904 [Mortierella claussenii]